MIDFVLSHPMLSGWILVLVYSILILTVAFLLSRSFRKTPYSYRNAGYTGLLLFLVFITLNMMSFLVFNRDDPYFSGNLLGKFADQSEAFAYLSLLPSIVFFISISISNISLMRHEGRRPRNMLGIFLGFILIALIIGTIMSDSLIFKLIVMPNSEKLQKSGTFFLAQFRALFFSIFVYLSCMLFGIIIHAWLVAHRIPAFDKDYIVILGCKVRPDNTPTPLLRGRIERAVYFANLQKEKTGKDIIFIASGGKGTDESISEAGCIRNYLISQGIPESQIRMDEKSTNTWENMKFSQEIILSENPNAKAAYSTTNYHVFRSGIYSKDAGMNGEGIGSKTKWYFWPNAFAREFVALLMERKKLHLLALIILIIYSILAGYCGYMCIFGT